ncbi:MAG: glycosyltransferase family 39 protein [Pirellulales bacterium]|nr:glycosyltransferase family 39 protein [Pirellulales bacterium]
MRLSTVKILLLLLLAAFLLRVAAGLWWQGRIGEGFGFADSQSYWSLGRAIASGEPYRFGEANSRVFRSPGYPAFLAPIFLLGGADPPEIWGRILGAVCGTLSVALVWWLARRLFNPTAGWIAAAIAAVYPEMIAGSVFILSEALFCPLMLVNLALWIVAWQTDSPQRAGRWAVAAGMTSGLATLVRPSWLLFLPFALGVGLVVDRFCGQGESRRPCAVNTSPTIRPHGRWRHLLLGLAMALGMTLAMMPWWIRNAQAVGRFVPTTLEVGASLYDGLNPRATGASDMSFVDRFIRQDRREPAGFDEPLEVRLDRRMRDDALAWARGNPVRVVQLAGIKLLRIWNIWPNEESLASWPMRLLTMLTYVPVLLLGILGAAKTIRRGWPYWLCWLPAVYFTLLHVVFVSSIRYRQPAMLGLIILAAGLMVARRRD